jgi:hypothetical protein
MVTLDTREVGTPFEDRSTRRYVKDDARWAVELLGRTTGRYRFRRGGATDAANLPGIVAMNAATPVALATVLATKHEIEIIAVASEPGYDHATGQLLTAVIAASGLGCKRIAIVCYNAELSLQRLVQQAGFTMCAVRAGAIASARPRLERGQIPSNIGGVPVRDEIEFELLVR